MSTIYIWVPYNWYKYIYSLFFCKYKHILENTFKPELAGYRNIKSAQGLNPEYSGHIHYHSTTKAVKK